VHDCVSHLVRVRAHGHACSQSRRVARPWSLGDVNRNGGIGWYVTFAVLAVGIFLAVGYLTGLDAIGAAVRFLWNALAFAVNALIRLLAGLLALLARGVGWRRLTRLSRAVAGVGLGYAGSVILSDAKVRRARGWRQKLKSSITVARNRWQRLHLAWKLAVVAVLMASQLYLHFLLIVFPIAFLVPVVRRLWVQAVDLLFGSWYWKTLGRIHRVTIAWLRNLPPFRQIAGATRVTRIRYLCAWRLWKHDPRYRRSDGTERLVSFIEPMRLWWRGELDRYIGRPLLAGKMRAPDLVATRN
jgi:hypothetical protein